MRHTGQILLKIQMLLPIESLAVIHDGQNERCRFPWEDGTGMMAP